MQEVVVLEDLELQHKILMVGQFIQLQLAMVVQIPHHQLLDQHKVQVHQYQVQV